MKQKVATETDSRGNDMRLSEHKINVNVVMQENINCTQKVNIDRNRVRYNEINFETDCYYNIFGV